MWDFFREYPVLGAVVAVVIGVFLIKVGNEMGSERRRYTDGPEVTGRILEGTETTYESGARKGSAEFEMKVAWVGPDHRRYEGDVELKGKAGEFELDDEVPLLLDPDDNSAAVAKRDFEDEAFLYVGSNQTGLPVYLGFLLILGAPVWAYMNRR